MTSSNSSFAETIRFTNGEYPPYCSEHLPHYGLWSQIVSEAFALENIQVEYSFFSWKRSLMLIENGQWEGSLAFSKTPERLQTLQFSETPLGEASVVFFHRKDVNFDWKTVDDLQGYKIGVMQGYATAEEMETLKKEGKKLNLDYATTEQLKFKQLLNRRIDIFPAVEPVGQYILRENFTPAEIAQITHHSLPWKTKQLHVVFSKKNPRTQQLYEAYERGIKKLKASGRFDEIMRRHLNTALSPQHLDEYNHQYPAG